MCFPKQVPQEEFAAAETDAGEEEALATWFLVGCGNLTR